MECVAASNPGGARVNLPSKSTARISSASLLLTVQKPLLLQQRLIEHPTPLSSPCEVCSSFRFPLRGSLQSCFHRTLQADCASLQTMRRKSPPITSDQYRGVVTHLYCPIPCQSHPRNHMSDCLPHRATT